MSSNDEMLYGLVKQGLVTPYLLLKGNLGAFGAGAVPCGAVSAPSLYCSVPISPLQALLDSADLFSAQPGASDSPYLPHHPACCRARIASM